MKVLLEGWKKYLNEEKTYLGITVDEWVDRFIDYWEAEREDPLQQPDYDDVDAWAPNTNITSEVWLGASNDKKNLRNL